MHDNRVYNMILTKRSFGREATYALLGHENGTTWNLLGGAQDAKDGSSEAAGKRELFEESGMVFKCNIDYMKGLPYYEHTKHKVFIHNGSLKYDIDELNKATAVCRSRTDLPHDFKEMHRYQLIKLSDLIEVAKNTKRGDNGVYKHSREAQPMQLDAWMLFSLKNNVDIMTKYV